MKANAATSDHVSSRDRAGSTAVDRWALRRIQQTIASAPIRPALWDGFELPSNTSPAVATIALRNRRALLGWLWDPHLNFGSDLHVRRH